MRVWRAGRHTDLRRNHESGIRLTWVGELNGTNPADLLHLRTSFDCIQAAATWLFLWFGAEPMLEKLDRIKVKYGMVEV